MAVYTTFFAAADAELDAAFPEWTRPLEVPIERLVRNPFTGELVSAKRWTVEPDEESPPPPPPETGFLAWLRRLLGGGPPARFGVTVVKGDYATFLEERAHPFVVSKPHWCTKGLLSLELAGLQKVLTMAEVDFITYMEKPALVAPRDMAAGLDLVPAELVDALCALPREECPRVAAELLEEKEWQGPALDVVEGTVARLRQIARQSKKAAANLYLMSEW
ncbi:MAG: hypothetical protein KC776_22380 [Myxococcales bacterium]|nr:hypothetical protein [Myxococcales bacterium]MCB9580174.1 hypothetical protein [Polyangiaceae bacterium]